MWPVTFQPPRTSSSPLLPLHLHLSTDIRFYRTKPQLNPLVRYERNEKWITRASLGIDNLKDWEKYWVVDSGCTEHMTCDERRLEDYSKLKEEGFSEVGVEDLPELEEEGFAWYYPNTYLLIAGSGNTTVFSPNSADGMTILDVYHIPGLKKNYLSVSQLCLWKRYFCLFDRKDVKFFDRKDVKFLYRKDVKIKMEPVIQGRLMKSTDTYVISSEITDEIDYEKDWIVFSGCSLHLTGYEQKLHNLSKDRGYDIGDTVIFNQTGEKELVLHNVVHDPGLKCNILSVVQLTDAGYIVLFDAENVMIFKHLEIGEKKPVMQGQRLENYYVMYSEPAS